MSSTKKAVSELVDAINAYVVMCGGKPAVLWFEDVQEAVVGVMTEAAADMADRAKEIIAKGTRQ